MRSAAHPSLTTDVREEDGERLLDLFDPGLARTDDRLSGRLAAVDLNGESDRAGTGVEDCQPAAQGFTFSLSWDEVCTRFETLNLNWDPALLPVTISKHWWVC